MKLRYVTYLVLLLAACERAPAPVQAANKLVKVDGSSTVYPVTEAVAEEYQAKYPGVKVTVGISGTGGGFKKFVRGEIDISEASRPILKDEMEKARSGGIEYIELPICFDALTVIINPANKWASTMDVADLKKIWEPKAQGKITRWNQVRPNWPNEKIVLFGPGTDSGTFDYFTEAVVGKAKSSRGDFTGSEDDNVLVQGVSGSKSALGYFGYAYYIANKDKLKAVAVSWNEKKVPPTKPSLDTVLSGKYAPLSRPLFIYVNRKSAEKPEVRDFVDFYLDNVKELATEVKYLPLPDATYPKVVSRFKDRQIGTAFGGTPEVGLHVEDILKREPKY